MKESGSALKQLKDTIEADGPIPFARFMEEALYGAEGYYAAPRRRIGKQGDFVTGSSLSPLFAACTHRLLERLDVALGRTAAMLEVGAGTGEHLSGVAERARRSGHRRIVGLDRMANSDADSPEPFERASSLEEIPPGSLHGLIFSYELFDALPIHRLVGGEDGLQEGCVGWSHESGFEWVVGPLSDPGLADLLDRELPPGQVADLSPGWKPLYEELAARLGRGLLVTCDYGFERDRLLDSRIRAHGTLACYRDQQVHRNPFVDFGEQDLTAHVDFTTLREAGEAAGLETFAFTRQARWLTACGLFEELEAADQQTRLDAMHLLDGGGMGDEIRVLVQGRDVSAKSILDLSLL